MRVAADAQEVGRRQEHAAARDARLKKLEEEACVAQEMFEVIQSKWNSLSLLNDPLDLYKDTENQRGDYIVAHKMIQHFFKNIFNLLVI